MFKAEKMLQWQTDPLLFDPSPLPQNHWLCANELIEKGELATAFLKNGYSLNLYPIMIRKIDFVTGERLLQSMPYLVLDAVWTQQIRRKSLAIAERCSYYFASSPADFSIKNWQKKVIRYAEKQKRIPFPMFRLVDNWQAFFEKECVRFQSARGENFWLPLKLTEELAYIIGVILGDGHLSDYAIYLVDQHENYIKKIARIMKQLFGGDILQYPHSQCNAFMLCQKGKWLVRLVNFLADQPIAEKKYDAIREPLIFQRNESLRASFWKGMMDTDGSYLQGIVFCSASERVVQDFCAYLQKHNISYKYYINQSEYGIGYEARILARGRKDFSRLIGGSNHPKKKGQLKKLLKSTRARKDIVSYLIKGIREDRLKVFEAGKYFDFALLANLQVEALGHWLKNWRQAKGLTQERLADLLSIAQNRISLYEKGIAIPLAIFIQILALDSQQALMPFLMRKQIDTFRSRKSVAKLPLQPSRKLAELLIGLKIRGRDVLGQSKQLESAATYFNVKKSKKRIENAVVRKFLETFMHLAPEGRN